jgi:hypothetical protein
MFSSKVTAVGSLAGFTLPKKAADGPVAAGTMRESELARRFRERPGARSD